MKPKTVLVSDSVSEPSGYAVCRRKPYHHTHGRTPTYRKPREPGGLPPRNPTQNRAPADLAGALFPRARDARGAGA
ncbi:hypothetical protein GCM10009735_42050 [Actinomadura chokoriensis]